MTVGYMGMTQRPEQVRAVVEAAAWQAQLTELGLESSEAFEHWLAADPEHEVAWTETQSACAMFDSFATSPEMIAVRRRALARGEAEQSHTFRGGRRAIAAIAATIMLMVGGTAIWISGMPETYRTAKGERRVVTLSDGSTISLNSGSEVKVSYTRDARELLLVGGQARFDVAHDAARPFSVTVQKRAVVATGTAFDIDLFRGNLAITMIEGRVVVVDAKMPKLLPVVPVPDPGSRQRAVLVAGDQMLANAAGTESIGKVNIDQVTAWETGHMIFEDEPLEQVAARVSRYASAPVLVAPGAGTLRVSGVFKTGDTRAFLDMVTRFLPVDAGVNADGATVLRRRG